MRMPKWKILPTPSSSTKCITLFGCHPARRQRGPERNQCSQAPEQVLLIIRVHGDGVLLTPWGGFWSERRVWADLGLSVGVRRCRAGWGFSRHWPTPAVFGDRPA